MTRAAQRTAFTTEAEMVATFCRYITDRKVWRRPDRWIPYHETGGFDLLLVEAETGVQVGMEAKLVFNLKVLEQALPRHWAEHEGPDYRAVLVPTGGAQQHLAGLAQRLGLGVVMVRSDGQHSWLPDERSAWPSEAWHSWLPARRCALPSYIPDIVGGRPAPVQMTEWKIRAIKLLILLERRGHVTRADFRSLNLSAARWTAPDGYLARRDGAYVAGRYTPDIRAQHPQAWAQIEADFEKWAPPTAALPLLQGALV